jgi:hypothetical protein
MRVRCTRKKNNAGRPKMSHSKRTTLSRETAIAGVVFLTGVLALLAGHSISIHWLESLVTELGVAFVIAAVLAVLVDGSLKLGLAKDVFETTFGYLLPKELRGELQWIHDQKLLCEHHSSHFTITKLDDRSVILRESFDRTFRNISNGTLNFSPSLSIDDWNHPTRKSRILLLGYEVDSKEVVQKEGELLVRSLDLGVITAVPKHDAIQLARDESIRVWGIIEEVPSLNGHHVSVFKYPTCNPHVRITADDSFVARAAFGHREKVHARELGIGVWQLEGVLLPNQPIRIEWRFSKQRSE